MQDAEAFVEVNDPHVAVRMRMPRTNRHVITEYDKLKASYADLWWTIRDRVSDKTRTKLRLSTSDTHRAAYFEFLNLEDSNAVADKLKAKLTDLGYKLTTERFPV